MNSKQTKIFYRILFALCVVLFFAFPRPSLEFVHLFLGFLIFTFLDALFVLTMGLIILGIVDAFSESPKDGQHDKRNL